MSRSLSDRGFFLGYAVMLAGVALLLVGFGVDAILHARDPSLAERETLFTLSNPGHAMVAAGIAVTVAGAFIGPYLRWVLRSGSRFLVAFVPVAALVAALGVSTVMAETINSLDHHSHDTATAAAAGHDHSSSSPAASAHAGHTFTVLPQDQAIVSLEESTFHEPANNQPVGADNMRFAESFLAQARAATAKYQDVAVARRDGYIQITPDLPLIGAHFFKFGADGLNPGTPGILLYHRDASHKWQLVGVAYTMPKQPGVDTPPQTPLGGLAHWHYHSNLCFSFGARVTIAQNQAHCGGVFIAETPWLLHVWIYLDSPEGVFNHANSLLQ